MSDLKKIVLISGGRYSIPDVSYLLLDGEIIFSPESLNAFADAIGAELKAELAAEKAKVLAAQHRLVCDPKDLRVAGLETAVMFWQDKWALYDRRAKELASAQLTIEKLREALVYHQEQTRPIEQTIQALALETSMKALEIDRLEQRIDERNHGADHTEFNESHRYRYLQSQLDELKKGE